RTGKSRVPDVVVAHSAPALSPDCYQFPVRSGKQQGSARMRTPSHRTTAIAIESRSLPTRAPSILRARSQRRRLARLSAAEAVETPGWGFRISYISKLKGSGELHRR